MVEYVHMINIEPCCVVPVESLADIDILLLAARLNQMFYIYMLFMPFQSVYKLYLRNHFFKC